jgi:hypothetical protein
MRSWVIATAAAGGRTMEERSSVWSVLAGTFSNSVVMAEQVVESSERARSSS